MKRSSHLIYMSFSLLILICVTQSFSQDFDTKYQKSELYNGMFVPTADPVSNVSTGVSLLTFPPAVFGKFASPLSQNIGIILDAGFMPYPTGLGGSVSLRFCLSKPDSDRWGVATQLQSIGGVAFWGGEGGGGLVNALEFIVSSPVRPNRINFGFAMHTMPGSEYKAGWDKAKKYDFKNPKPMLLLSVEHSGKKYGVYTEAFWAGIGADDNWDSGLAWLIGSKFIFGKVTLKVGAGLFVERVATTNPLLLPVPPIIALIVKL
jgi:hypothetical protein